MGTASAQVESFKVYNSTMVTEKQLRARALKKARARRSANAKPSIFARLAKLGETLPAEELDRHPADFTENFHHYMHGYQTPHATVGEMVIAVGKRVPPEEQGRFPKDGAHNHDHYIYGAPKRK